MILGAALVAGAFAATPAAAAKYKCNCYKDAKASLEASEGQNINCVDTYTKHNESSSVKEKYLKVYVDSDNKVQGDNDATIRFRPRDGRCLLAVYDGNASTIRWGGVYCNNDSYKKIKPFNFEKQPAAYTPSGVKMPDTYTATYKAETDSKHYKGFLLFTKAADDKKYMQAVCIEDR
tara:strand:- start:1487 stop:2017 length:531 start_codon:yes stop_codon:yes gene_type:complete